MFDKVRNLEETSPASNISILEELYVLQFFGHDDDNGGWIGSHPLCYPLKFEYYLPFCRNEEANAAIYNTFFYCEKNVPYMEFFFIFVTTPAGFPSPILISNEDDVEGIGGRGG